MNIKAHVKREAVEWVVRLSSHDVSVEHEKSFALWLESSPHNQLAYIQAEKAWFACSSVSAKRRSSSFSWPTYAWACSAFVVCVAALLFFSFTGVSVTKSETYWVGKAGVETRFLPDGSTITLLPEFEGRFVVSNNAREFEIISGEAFFDVKSDPDKKFVVQTKFGHVEVVGTKFSVSLEESDASISVLEGVVKITSEGGSREGVLVRNQSQSFVNLSEGREIQAIDADSQLSWSRGLYVLEERSLSEAVALLEDLLSISIELPIGEASDVRLIGAVSLEDVEVAVKTLASLSGYEFVRKSDKEYELRK